MLTLFILAPSLAAHADWVQDGTSLNMDTSEYAGDANILINNATPYVVWSESQTTNANNLYLKCLNGNTWKNIGGILNVNSNWNAKTPNIAIENHIIYLTWYEENSTYTVKNIYAKKYQINNDIWEQMGNSLNAALAAMGPKIAVGSNHIPYVTWSENPRIFVKHYDGATWVPDGGNLNNDISNFAGGENIATFNGVPYVIWKEYNISSIHIYVKHLNGNNWDQDGGDLDNGNLRNAAYPPAIAFSTTTPYVSIYVCQTSANNLCVKHLNGTNWVQDGDALNSNKNQFLGGLSLAVYNNTPYVAFQDEIGSTEQIYVKYFDGNNWVQIGGCLNVDATKSANGPSISFSDQGTPYVAWTEGNGSSDQLYVKHWVPPATPTISVTFTPTINFQNKKIIAYPNPAKDLVHFVWEEPQAEKVQVEIFNTAAERVASFNAPVTGRGVDWNARGIAPGIYFCRITLTVNGFEQKLAVQKVAITR
jgi:hypothetical protein